MTFHKVTAGLYRNDETGIEIKRVPRRRLGRTGWAAAGWAIVIDGRTVDQYATLKAATEKVEADQSTQDAARCANCGHDVDDHDGTGPCPLDDCESFEDPADPRADLAHLATDDGCDTLCGIDLVVISDDFPGGVTIATDMACLTCPQCKAKGA